MSAESQDRPGDSYGQILKSSALIGSSQAFVIGAGIVRAKAMALLLGPAGFGLVGIYTSIVDLAVSAAGLGVGSSGVRQIAESAASNDISRIQRTVAALRKATRVLAIVGAVLLAALASMMSGLTFGDNGHTWAIAIISLAVLFRILTVGQTALIQGLRRISDLAMMNLLGAIAGTLAAITLIYFLGEKGIAISVVAVAFFAFVISTWYSRHTGVPTVSLARGELRQETGQLLKLGVAFLVSALLMMGAAYVVRAMVARELGLDAAGLYSASWTLGGMYVGMLLQAMGADFYPRLTGVSTDNDKCNRLVNEQTRVSLLLAGPGVIVTLTFAPLLMALFYSQKFTAAAGLLQWLCLGMTLRVISWPMGYIIVAKGDRTLFVVTEVAWTIVNLGLTWFCLRQFGLNGAGIAFFGSYVFHAVMIYCIVRRYTRFRFSAENVRTIVLLLMLLAVIFGSFFVLRRPYAIVFGTLCAVGCGLYSLRLVTRLVSPDAMPSALRRLLRILHLVPAR
jgi:enterobacterial common antigen flippase